jgi:hypothetical protein
MTAGAEGDREQRALEALIASAFFRDDRVEDEMDPAGLSALSAEKERALDEVGSDFVQRLLNDQWRHPKEMSDNDCLPEEEFAFAGDDACFGLDRAEEIDEETQAELDDQRRRIRERKDGHEQDDAETAGE